MSLAWVARLPRYLWLADRTKQQSTASSSGALVHRAHCKGMSGISETSTSSEDAPSEPRKIHIDYGRYAESAVDVGGWCWPIPTTVAIQLPLPPPSMLALTWTRRLMLPQRSLSIGYRLRSRQSKTWREAPKAEPFQENTSKKKPRKRQQEETMEEAAPRTESRHHHCSSTGRHFVDCNTSSYYNSFRLLCLCCVCVCAQVAGCHNSELL